MLPAFTFTARLKKNEHNEMIWSIFTEDRLLCIVDGDWDGSQKCFKGKIRPKSERRLELERLYRS